MYSSEDLERFYFQYQTEAMPNGISIERFCSRNKVPYNVFYKWYKDTRNKIVEVKVDGLPSSVQEHRRYINYLAERVREADLGLHARDLILQDFLDKQKEYDVRLSKLDETISRIDDLEKSLREKDRKLKSAERKVADLSAKLRFADKNRFGDKRQSVKKKVAAKSEESDRGKDEDDFDNSTELDVTLW